ncbi:hypothetical protein [Pseudomonas viridiflava]|uniref:hypothetical protein n=1 Tax=Pseudomonas viridiflava TaxID=33069 RepID=UPI001C2DBEA1|nr:hypothetical protein [Pseudomonas viridiflava]MBV1806423.1 hypothetical protein [Pseudomonas viridiflava]
MANDSSETKALEWMQSKTLAEHLIPLLNYYDVKWRGHGVIYVDHEQYNINTAHMIITDLSVTFGVPAHLIRARLEELKLLKDVRNILSAKDQTANLAEQVRIRKSFCAYIDTLETDEADQDI